MIDFGDYVRIEMKRYGAPNEMYLHKVIGRSFSSHAAVVPIDAAGSDTKPVEMDEMRDVLRVVCCGVCEDQIFRVAERDVKIIPDDIPSSPLSQPNKE